MKKRNKVTIYTLVLCFIMLNFHYTVSASELNFNVSAVIPENQIDKGQTYFDLHMEPNKKQTIEIVLKNETKRDVTVEVLVNTAMTNSNGIIDYSQSDFERDPSLQIDLEDLVDYEKEVVIKAGSSKHYPVTLQMPSEEFDGILLGGIQFQEKDIEQPEENAQQINNKFAYVVGLQLSMNGKRVDPYLFLNEVKATHINYRNAIIANIQNSEPVIVSPLEITANIYKENGNKSIFSTEKKNLRMAPNSNFNYSIDVENQEFKPGKYRLEMEAISDEHVWEWTEYFTIAKEEANELNKGAVALEKDYTIWLIVIASIIFILLLVLVYWLGTKKHKKE